MYGVAISASMAVLVVMLASITLLPALLSYLGPKVDRLRIPFLGRGLDAGGRRRIARRPLEPRRPAPALDRGDRSPPRSCSRSPRRRSACASASPTPATTGPGTMTRQAYDLISEGFGPGANGPLVIAAELPDPRGEADGRTAWRRQLRAEDGVAYVAPPRFNSDGDAALAHRHPDHLAPGRGDDQELVDHLREDRGPGRARRLRRRRPASAASRAALEDQSNYITDRMPLVHRRRRRALLPAPAGRLPLAADLAQGGDDEPALGQRRLRRDDPGRPGRRGRRTDRDRPRSADRARSCR